MNLAGGNHAHRTFWQYNQPHNYIWRTRYTFYKDELQAAIKTLKRNKATGIDILHNIVQKYLLQVFDFIYRHGLWYKLFKEDVDGNMLTLLWSLYGNVK